MRKPFLALVVSGTIGGMVAEHLSKQWSLSAPLLGLSAGITQFMVYMSMNYTSSRRLRQTPGVTLELISDFICSARTHEQVTKPAIADMQYEYFQALAEKRKVKAMWVRLRGTCGVLVALGLYRLTKTLWEVWRSIQ